jgi:hypothetical protein
MTSNIPAESPPPYNSLFMINKTTLLEQSSYLTRLNSFGCREKTRKNTAYVVSVTFNSDVFPKIKKDGVFRIIPNKEYKNLLSTLNENSEFKSDSSETFANIFRLYDATTNQLACVGYGQYTNTAGQTALEGKPTQLIVTKKGSSQSKIDEIFQNFLHDWAASFGISELINGGRIIQIPKTEQELIAAQYCKANPNSQPWSTYEQGRLSQTHQKTYALMGSQLGDNPEDISNSIQGSYMIKLFQESTLKEMNIFAQSVRTYFFGSPFTKSKLFKIYYSGNLLVKNDPDEIYGLRIFENIKDHIMGDAKQEGFEKKQDKYRGKMEQLKQKQELKAKKQYKNLLKGGASNTLPTQEILSNIPELNQILQKVMNRKGFASNDIEQLADLLAKNGAERYTIDKINNSNKKTMVNDFLNIDSYKKIIDEFIVLVKKCNFRFDCKSKKQVQGMKGQGSTESNELSGALVRTFNDLNDLFDEFVAETYFSGDITNSNFIITDNYPELKQAYIKAFVKLQQQAKISRRGTGPLNYDTKAAIRKEKGLDPEEDGSYRLAVISNFFGALAANYLAPAGRAIKRGAVATKRGIRRGLEGVGNTLKRSGQKMQGIKSNKYPLQNETSTTSVGQNPTTGLFEAGGGGRRKRKNKTNRINKRKPRYYLKTLKKRKGKSKKNKK